jgi:PAS domain S-box-containing protein
MNISNTTDQFASQYARQLQFATALTDLSELMLASGRQAADYQQTLRAIAQRILTTVRADRVALYSYSGPQPGTPDWAADMRLVLVTEYQHPHLPPHRRPTQEEIYGYPPVIIETMRGGESFNGPVDHLFADYPAFERYITDNQIKALLNTPLYTDTHWWGHLAVVNCTTAQSWQPDEIAFLRTAGRLVLTFVQGWQAQQALHEREALLREVSQLAQIGGWELDLAAQAVVWSEQIYHVMGIDLPPGGERQPMAFADTLRLLPPEYHALLQAKIAAASTTGTAWALELPLITTHGHQRWVQMQGRPIFRNGVATHLRGTLQDITVRKQQELALAASKAAAEAADRAKSSFLAVMSHEIRTPLNAVIGMTSLLSGTELSAEQAEYVTVIRSSGANLLTLINDILDLSRIEADQLVLEEQPFNLIECLQEAVDLLAHQAQAKGLALQLAFATIQTAFFYGDLSRIRQIVINLLANAIKFTAQGEVELQAQVHATSTGQWLVRISVRDTGIGIAPDQLERIFLPFQQADTTTTRQHGGTGLGLAISRQLALHMGGTLQVTSTLGRGSTFTLELLLTGAAPAYAERLAVTPAPRTPIAPPNVPIRPLRILIAEDNLVNQQVALKIVQRLGYTADLVANGLEVLTAVQRQPYDVILMDVQMPHLDGETATLQIRALGSAIAQPYIIALTAFSFAHDRSRSLAAGMDAYLSKPIQIDALAQLLAHAPIAAAVPPTAEPPLIDWQDLHMLEAQLADEDQPPIALICSFFDQELGAQVAAIQACLLDDRQQLAALAHRMRGASLQLGAKQVAVQSTVLEQQAVTASPEQLRALIDQLEVRYRETRTAIYTHYERFTERNSNA